MQAIVSLLFHDFTLPSISYSLWCVCVCVYVLIKLFVVVSAMDFI